MRGLSPLDPARPPSGLQTWTGRDGASVQYAAVRSWGAVWVAAGGPDGPAEHRRAAAVAFEADARAAGARVLWFAVDHLADVPEGRPSLVIGAEPVWRAGRWPEIVAQKSSLRAQIRRARNKGVEVEAWAGERAQSEPVLREVLADWLSSRGLPPLAFMASPFVLDAPGDRQFWIARQRGRVVGYLALQPGEEAFVEWIIRRRDSPNGTAAVLLDAAVRSLPADTGFTLGLVPLSTRAPLSDASPSLAVRTLLAWTRAHASRFYNFGGLERFKSKFVPDLWRPLHLVTDGRPVSILTFHAVAAAFASPRGPTRFVARALADAVAEEVRGVRQRLAGRLSGLR